MDVQLVPSVGLIGCGRWGSNIARTLSSLGALRGIADPAADLVGPLGKSLGVEVLPSADLLLSRSDIQAVAIASPAVDHARLVKAALAAGKHVFVEKPLALTLSDAHACAAAARAAGRQLMVGHLLQYHPAFARLIELIGEGAIGKVRHITSHRLNQGAIRTDENALWSLAPHDFSMILRICSGAVIEVGGQATGLVDPGIPDQYLISLRFSDGVTAQVYVSWLSPYKEHKLVVLGETGAIVFEDTAKLPALKLLIFRDHIDRANATPRYRKSDGEPVAFSTEEPLHIEMAWFLDVVRGTRLPLTGADEAIPVLDLLSRADEASLTDTKPTARNA